jgi:transposase
MAKQKQKVVTSGLEMTLLQDYAKSSPLVLVRLKAQAVLLASSGVADDAIARAFARQPRTIGLWLGDWVNRRLASIFTGHKDNNNAGKFSREQLAEIKRVLQSPPSEQGLPKEFWDVPQLKTYTTTTFGVTYGSDRSYRFLLKFSDLSFKYPDTFDRKRDETLITERMVDIRTEIAPLLAGKDWEVFACDEVKMQQEAIIRKAWLKRGRRTVIKVNRDKQSQSYIGFLNQKSFTCHLYEMPWQNSDEVLKATKQFLKQYPHKKICIVWDNAPFHKSKAIKEQLKAGGLLERVHLIALPPYAPDNNPIEHVWNTAKQTIANIQHETFGQTKQALSDFVASRQFRYSF